MDDIEDNPNAWQVSAHRGTKHIARRATEQYDSAMTMSFGIFPVITAVVRAPLPVPTTAVATVRILLASASLATAVVESTACGQLVTRLASRRSRLKVSLLTN